MMHVAAKYAPEENRKYAFAVAVVSKGAGQDELWDDPTASDTCDLFAFPVLVKSKYL